MQFLAKLGFAATQYVWLLAIVLAGFGAGHLLLGRGNMLASVSDATGVLIRIAAGVGVLVVSLFVIGAGGALNRSVVAAGLGATVCIALVIASSAVLRRWRVRHDSGFDCIAWLRREWFWPTVLFVAVLPLVLRPLQPPGHWDELMYHLPHAEVWAREGRLTVNTWLRYPLFPFNFNLLFAAALLFGNDILPHLMHALAGWLVAAGVYLGASRFFDRRVGLLAAIMFLHSVRWGFELASIDLGLTLFVFFGFLSLALWQEVSDGRWLYLSMFFMGLAIGTKYHGLLYVPLAGLLVIGRERRVRPLLTALAVLTLSGGYWYVRNYLVSGNPVHPLAQGYFGYWLWDRGDVQGQLADLRRQFSFPPWYLSSSILGLLFLPRSTRLYQALCAVALGATALWASTAVYARYLTPAYPLLAVVSAYTALRLVKLLRLDVVWRSRFERIGRGWRLLLQVCVIAVVGLRVAGDVNRFWRLVFTTPPQREAYLSDRFASYDILRAIPADAHWRIYQLGFEGEIYLSPVVLLGDWFGPARYRDVLALAHDSVALAAHLRSLGANGFLINREREPFAGVRFDGVFPRMFEEVGKTPSAELYRLRDVPLPVPEK